MLYHVGDWVRGRDDYYDVELAGIVDEVVVTRSGETEVLFKSEIAGDFEGCRVALLTSQITEHKAGPDHA